MKLQGILLPLLAFFWISSTSANTSSQVPVSGATIAPASVENLLQRQNETARIVDQKPLVAVTKESTTDQWATTWKARHAKAHLAWAGESEIEFRWRIGFRVMFFLILFFFLAQAVKNSFWKDIENKNNPSEYSE